MNKGAYILLLRLPENNCITVGRLGEIDFHKGYYAYVGSAMNNIEKRVARHQRADKPQHWHIDYLRPHTKWVTAWRFETLDRIECRLNSVLADLPGGRPVPKFGSSDCRCRSHLHWFCKNPRGLIQQIQASDFRIA